MKNINKLRNLSLASLAFFSLCACSPKEEGLDIQAIIPQDAEIALYAKTNQKIISATKAIPEYKEVLNSLKEYNPSLETAYLDFTSEATPEQRKVVDAFINPKDVVGSIEKLLLDQDISVSLYLKNSMMAMMGKINGLVAIKSGNETFPKKVLDMLNSIDTEFDYVSKSKLENYDLFECKVGDSSSVFLLNIKDSFLIASEKTILVEALKEIANPTSSILDSADFKNTISDPNSDTWLYASEGIGKIVSLMTKQDPLFKSAGIEFNAESIESSTLKAKWVLNDKKYLPAIFASYTNFNDKNLAKNTYDDSVIFASVILPNDITGLLSGLGYADVALEYNIFAKHIKAIELSASKGISTNIEESPEIIINAYCDTLALEKQLLGENIPFKSINGIDCLEMPKGTVAKVSAEQVSLIADKNNVEATLDIVKAGKSNANIAKALSNVPMDNCIAEIYADLKAMQKFSNALNSENEDPTYIELQKMLDEFTEKSTIVLKLGITADSLSLIAKTDSKYNFKVLKDILSLTIKSIEKEANYLLGF